MTSDNIERGVQGETAVLNRLVQKGFEVLIPWGGRRRYDIAYFVTVEHRNFGFFVHHESCLVRIQVKIGRLASDESGIDFNTTSVHPKGKKHFRRDYVGDAEYFGVYCPELDKVYMVPGLDDGRRLLVWEQQKKCPAQFPRSGSLMAKKPLGEIAANR